MVGTYSSNVGRLVHELMGADRHRDATPAPPPPFFDLDGLSSWWIPGDGLAVNSIRGFWQHLALQKTQHCVLKTLSDHRPACSKAKGDARPGVYLADGSCVAGCKRLDLHGRPGRR